MLTSNGPPAAFFLATNANPNSFDNFKQINSFFRASGEGDFCIPLDLASSNATGLQAGQNVTIQVTPFSHVYIGRGS